MCQLSGEKENKVRVEKGSLPQGGLRVPQGQQRGVWAPCAQGIHLGMASKAKGSSSRGKCRRCTETAGGTESFKLSLRHELVFKTLPV